MPYESFIEEFFKNLKKEDIIKSIDSSFLLKLKDEFKKGDISIIEIEKLIQEEFNYDEN
ncbi:hypothetical protein [Methanobrevibacter sp. DSM 116169]|uniref:hypothetical protein n=1 Tax=Methanobrevibacter sp. DSM 116169 TaxID=3242727 RepID=UPI0038FC3B53